MSSPSVLGPRSYTFNLRQPPVRTRSAMPFTTTSMSEPPKGLAQPHNRDLALQKYLLLLEEHDHLRQNLDTLLPIQSIRGVPKSTPVSPTVGTYLSSSSSSQMTSRSHSLSQVHSGRHRRPSLPAATTGCLETVIDESTVAEVAGEESRLCHVNESIKRVLTGLLNCEAVRADRAFRTWVQCRLMDTEKELRTGRRRRSAPEFCTPV